MHTSGCGFLFRVGGGLGWALAQPLSLEVYNPGEHAVFPVSSSLITGEREAILVDAQFSTREAQALVERIQASGKTLTTIFISHGDPDFYFGLDTLTRAYLGGGH